MTDRSAPDLSRMSGQPKAPCPKCGRLNVWYVPLCKRCGKVL